MYLMKRSKNNINTDGEYMYSGCQSNQPTPPAQSTLIAPLPKEVIAKYLVKPSGSITVAKN